MSTHVSDLHKTYGSGAEETYRLGTSIASIASVLISVVSRLVDRDIPVVNVDSVICDVVNVDHYRMGQHRLFARDKSSAGLPGGLRFIVWAAR